MLAPPRETLHGDFETAGRFSFGRITILAELQYSTEAECYGDDSLIVDAIVPTDMIVKDSRGRFAHIDLTNAEHRSVAESFDELLGNQFRDRVRSICNAHWESIQRFGR